MPLKVERPTDSSRRDTVPCGLALVDWPVEIGVADSARWPGPCLGRCLVRSSGLSAVHNSAELLTEVAIDPLLFRFCANFGQLFGRVPSVASRPEGGCSRQS